MEMLRERGELERERDQLKNQIEGKYLTHSTIIKVFGGHIYTCPILGPSSLVITIVICIVFWQSWSHSYFYIVFWQSWSYSYFYIVFWQSWSHSYFYVLYFDKVEVTVIFVLYFDRVEVIVILYCILTELKSQLEIAQHTLDQQSVLVADKEREGVKRVQAAREEEWAKLHTVQNEK